MLSRLRVIRRRLTQHRSTRLTSEGLQFLLFTLAVGVAAINTGNNLFYLLLAMMLSIILISGIVAEHCLRRLEFHRYLPDLLFVNEPTTATLVVKNCKSRLPSFSLRLHDVTEGQDLDHGLAIRQLLPTTSRMLSYPVISVKRGRLQLDGVRVVTLRNCFTISWWLDTSRVLIDEGTETIYTISVFTMPETTHERSIGRRPREPQNSSSVKLRRKINVGPPFICPRLHRSVTTERSKRR